MLGEIFLSVCLFEKSWRTVINHVIVGPRYVIEYERLFNETRVQWVPLEMVYERFDVAQPEVVGEKMSLALMLLYSVDFFIVLGCQCSLSTYTSVVGRGLGMFFLWHCEQVIIRISIINLSQWPS